MAPRDKSASKALLPSLRFCGSCLVREIAISVPDKGVLLASSSMYEATKQARKDGSQRNYTQNT